MGRCKEGTTPRRSYPDRQPLKEGDTVLGRGRDEIRAGTHVNVRLSAASKDEPQHAEHEVEALGRGKWAHLSA
jgi:hypothetical protein